MTTAVTAKAMLSLVVIVNAPVGIRTIWPPPADTGLGAVIVVMVAVPLTKLISLVGAIVASLAIVGAAASVAISPDVVRFANTVEPLKVGLEIVGVLSVGLLSVALDARTGAPVPVATVHTGSDVAPPPTRICVESPAPIMVAAEICLVTDDCTTTNASVALIVVAEGSDVIVTSVMLIQPKIVWPHPNRKVCRRLGKE